MRNRQGFFNSRALFWGLGLSLVLRKSVTSFWISEILGIIMGVVLIIFIKKKNSSKIIKAISGFIITLLSLIILSYIGSTLYFKETPTLLIAIPPVLGSFIMSRGSKMATKRTCSILICYTLFLFIFSSGLLLKEVEIDNLFPIFYHDFKGVILSAIIFFLTSVTPLITLNEIDDKKELLENYLMSTLSVLLISFLIVSILGSEEATLFRYPEYVILKRIKVYEFFTNMDNIFFIAMIVDLLITASAGFKNMNITGKYTRFIVPVLALIITNFAIGNSQIVTILLVTLPLILSILLIATLIPKKNKYTKYSKQLK